MLLIFDLDGTLIDSSEDLAISVNAMLRNAGRAEMTRDVIQSYVGNGAPVLVRRAFGQDASEEAVKHGLAFFMKYYRAHSLEHTKLYPGIRDAVEQLASEHKLAILTNKPERISSDIIEGLGIRECFAHVYGGDRFANKKPNPVGIEALMENTGMLQPETVMIGDTSIDIETARNAGVRSCGVQWGFRPESFNQVPPDILVQSPDEMVRQLIALQ